MTAGWAVSIFANVNPFDVPNEVTDKSLKDCVEKVLLLSSGDDILPVSLKDCVATILTLNSVAPPLVKPPKPNNSVSADERIDVEPPELESKSIA